MQLAAHQVAQVASTRPAPASAARLSQRSVRKHARAFKGARRSVKVAAAEPEAAPEQQAPRRRQQRTVTLQMEDLKPGLTVQGTVTSVESYGAFVNIGAEMDGLVHVSQLKDGYVKNTADVVKVGDAVTVKVLTVDPASKRLALTMKGLNAAPAAAAFASADEEAEAEEDNEVLLADNEAVYDGIVFRVEGNEAVDETDEFEEATEAHPAVDLAASDLVTGTVVGVEDFGVIVEFQAGGKTYQGLLHVSDMAVPGAAARAELEEEDAQEAEEAEEEGEQAAPQDAAAALFADEAEYELDEYVDMGGVDSPARYYKVGDAISAFVVEVEGEDGRKVSLSQLVDAENLLEDDEAEEDEEDLLEKLDPLDAEDDDELFEVDGDDEDRSFTTQQVASGVFYGQTQFAPERASSALIQGARDGAMVVASSFPDRPMNTLRDSGLKAPQAMVAEDDDGEESELVDFWTNDNAIPKGFMKSSGYKIVTSEEGEVQLVKREDAEEEGAGSGLDLYQLLNGIDGAQVDAIVDELLAGDADEAELPYLAMRRGASAVRAASAAGATISAADVKKLRTATGAGMMDCKKALGETGGDFDKAVEWLRQKGITGASKKAGRVAAEGAIYTYIHPGSRLGVIIEVNCETDFVAAGDVFRSLVAEIGMVAASSEAVCVSVDDVPADLLAKERDVQMGMADIQSKPEAVRTKIVEGRLDKLKKTWALLEQPALRDNDKTVAEIVKEAIAATGENIQVRRFVKFNLGEGLEKRSNDFAAEVAQQTQAKADKPAAPAPEPAAAKPAEQPKEEAKPKVQVSSALVKQLRDKSGAGMMDCKKALAENGGDIEAASEWLRKKGLASADKKAGRLAAEGAVMGYIHPGSRLGVLLEINCETDFVAASDEFQRLAQGVAMQIAASPAVEYVTTDEIPGDAFAAEMAVEMGREDLQSKPENIRQKIAEGRVKKSLQERVLMEQQYLMDESKTVSEAVKEAIATIGENIQVRRFVKYQLGEGIEKKETNLAAEVAAATGQA